MKLNAHSVIACLVLICGELTFGLTVADDEDPVTNILTPQSDEPVEVVIKLPTDNEAEARQIADDNHMIFQGKVGDLKGMYLLGYKNDSSSRRTKREVEQTVQGDNRVIWSQPQKTLKRVKRIVPALRPSRLISTETEDAEDDHHVEKRWARWQIDGFSDPLFKDQWYLGSGARDGHTMKVREAWLLGYSGQGVAVTILDDGLQRDQPDIAPNYDVRSSHDLNGFDNNPTPRDNGFNQHGTRCASLVASVADNNLCTAGIAFNASIGGIRMLDGFVTDGIEASAFGHNQQHIDIYSSSWGPEDDGTTFDGPGPLARTALRQGITSGRGGLGNIYVWATGNGNNKGDSCAFDGYLTSIYTVGATAATFNNAHPWYSEKCASIICVAYSSGHNALEPAIVSAEHSYSLSYITNEPQTLPAADVPRGCTRNHSGTSASAPMVSAVIALMLQANHKLTWRDVQHILIRSSDARPLSNAGRWKTNGVRRQVSDEFGYGIVDAQAAVRMSRAWSTVPKQHGCKVVFGINQQAQQLTGRFSRSFGLDIGSECAAVRHVEHVQLMVDMPYVYRRGALEITVTSPAGTKSTMMPARPRDTYSGDLDHSNIWPFMSRQQWGEATNGRWTLTMTASGSFNKATVTGVTLVLYGTTTKAQSGDARQTTLRRGRRRRYVPRA